MMQGQLQHAGAPGAPLYIIRRPSAPFITTAAATVEAHQKPPLSRNMAARPGGFLQAMASCTCAQYERPARGGRGEEEASMPPERGPRMEHGSSS